MLHIMKNKGSSQTDEPWKSPTGHDAGSSSKRDEVRTDQTKEQTEQALKASELSYRRLFETAKDGILILDVDTGSINDANPL